jgi:hypothetical protein
MYLLQKIMVMVEWKKFVSFSLCERILILMGFTVTLDIVLFWCMFINLDVW